MRPLLNIAFIIALMIMSSGCVYYSSDARIHFSADVYVGSPQEAQHDPFLTPTPELGTPVLTMQPTSTPEPECKVMSVDLNVRTCPSTTCNVLNILSSGDVVSVIDGSGTWWQIDQPTSGWVAGWLVNCG